MNSLFTASPKELSELVLREEDPQDQRLAHCVERVEAPFGSFLEQVKAGDVVILGYPDDRGVERNGGRTGAFAAPDLIRKFLFRLTPSYAMKSLPKIYDIGNLKTWSQDLLLSHEEARGCIKSLRQKGVRLITLGGGHDWAYPDFVDFAEAHPTRKARVINVDAHLDVRPEPSDEKRKGHSGTPFRRILSLQSQKVPEIMALGLQETCNAKAHVDWAHSRHVTTLFLEEFPENLERRWPFVTDRLQLADTNAIYGLSIDLDAFPQFMSPGTSAPQSFGVDPRLVYKMLQTLGGNIDHLGIYEYNPSFDVDGRSARLAAHLIHVYLMTISKK
ncbi:MAG: formimidoylglutamase [Bdellovibrionota bacterium]